ncbi:MAG: hypothetical protein RR858_02210, partial [Mucinivorans sp.]
MQSHRGINISEVSWFIEDEVQRSAALNKSIRREFFAKFIFGPHINKECVALNHCPRVYGLAQRATNARCHHHRPRLANGFGCGSMVCVVDCRTVFWRCLSVADNGDTAPLAGGFTP